MYERMRRLAVGKIGKIESRFLCLTASGEASGSRRTRWHREPRSSSAPGEHLCLSLGFPAMNANTKIASLGVFNECSARVIHKR
jgi:hypothetical protein